ncbi:tyrosine-protein kinase domain-containing protein [Jatrophihabitans fulvus]
MSLREFFAAIRRRWAVVAVLTVAAVVVAGVVSFTETPLYRASASVYFTLPFGDTAGDLSQGSSYTQSQMLTYAQTASLPVVLGPASEALGGGLTADDLASKVTASASTDTVIIEIKAVDRSPRQAARIANAVATQLEATARELSPKSDNGDPTVDAQTVSPAKPPSAPFTPRKTVNLAIGLLGGLLIGLAIAVLIEMLNTRVRGRRDVVGLTDAPVLGEIMADRAVARDHVVLRDNANSVQAEAFRRVQTNLSFLGVDRDTLALVVTSTLPQEGKSSISVNLALASAEAGKRTLLIDADLRSPSVATYLQLEGAAGLSNVLIGQVDFDDVVQPYGVDSGLDVLASGPVPPTAGRLLGSSVMRQLLADVAARYDVVLLDCAPLLAVTDAAVLARELTGAIVVAQVSPVGRRLRRLRRARVARSQFIEALGSLEQLGADVLGVVLNGVGRKAEAYYGYGQIQPARRLRFRRSASAQVDPDEDTAAQKPAQAGKTVEPNGDTPPTGPKQQQLTKTNAR